MTKQDVLKLEIRLLLMVPRLGTPVVIVVMVAPQVILTAMMALIPAIIWNTMNGVLDASSS